MLPEKRDRLELGMERVAEPLSIRERTSERCYPLNLEKGCFGTERNVRALPLIPPSHLVHNGTRASSFSCRGLPRSVEQVAQRVCCQSTRRHGRPFGSPSQVPLGFGSGHSCSNPGRTNQPSILRHCQPFERLRTG